MVKKRGRPKTKNGKKVTFYLSLNCIEKLGIMTRINRNASKLVEDLIMEKYLKHKEL